MPTLCRLLLLVFLLPVGMAAERPEPFSEHWYVQLAATDAPLARDWQQRVLAWNHRSLVESWQQVGQHNPAWDDDARMLLREWAVRFSGGKEELGTDAMHKLANSLRSQQELTDPLVWYLIGKTIELNPKQKKDAAHCYIRAGAGWATSAYQPNRRFVGQMRHFEALRALNMAEAPATSPLLAQALAELPAMLAGVGYEPDAKGSMLRQMVDQLCTDYLTGAEGRRYFYEQLLVATGPNPTTWQAQAVAAWAHERLGWQARGGGYANTVTEEGWRLFAQHLGQAERLYTAAWQLAPETPFAATKMIGIAMAHDTQDDEATWFRRAISAEFDHRDALAAMDWALRPRWGGSHETMLAMGRICAATKRHDTCVPLQLTDEVLYIYQESKRFKEPAMAARLFADQQLWLEVDAMLQGYLKAEHAYLTAEWVRSLRVAYAWRFNQHETALTEAKSLGPELDKKALELLDITLEELTQGTSDGQDAEGF